MASVKDSDEAVPKEKEAKSEKVKALRAKLPKADEAGQIPPTSGRKKKSKKERKERKSTKDWGNLEDWVMKTDKKSGKTYYSNKQLKLTKWKPPPGWM